MVTPYAAMSVIENAKDGAHAIHSSGKVAQAHGRTHPRLSTIHSRQDRHLSGFPVILYDNAQPFRPQNNT